jgi:hypothetical protein
MKLAAHIQRRCGWINLSTATLVALLQRTPVLRVVAAEGEFVAASPIGTVFKSAVAVIASLGAIDSMAGATVLATSITPSPSGATLPNFDATVGAPPSPRGLHDHEHDEHRLMEGDGKIPPGLVLTTKESPALVLTGPGNLDATTPGPRAAPMVARYDWQQHDDPDPGGHADHGGHLHLHDAGLRRAGEMGGSGGTFVGTGISAIFPFTVVVASGGRNVRPRVHDAADLGLGHGRDGGPERRGQQLAHLPVDVERLDAGQPARRARRSSSATPRRRRDLHLRRDQLRRARATSNPATVGIDGRRPHPGRLINLSARAEVGTGAEHHIRGFVIGGGGTSGSARPRARLRPGIAAAPFGVPGTLPDPQLQLFNSANGRAGDEQRLGRHAEHGLAGGGRRLRVERHDEPRRALVETLARAGAYTAQVAGESGDTGDALVEVYDATPAGTYTLASPRLVNLSARVDVGTGANILFAGFVIGGNTALTVLIRASGPAIAVAPFGRRHAPRSRAHAPEPGHRPSWRPTISWGGNAEISTEARRGGHAFAWAVPSSARLGAPHHAPPGGVHGRGDPAPAATRASRSSRSMRCHKAILASVWRTAAGLRAGAGITAVPLPDPQVPGFHFPESESTIVTGCYEMGTRRAADAAAAFTNMYTHGWGLWTALTLETSQVDNGERLRVFETWYTPQEIDAPGPSRRRGRVAALPAAAQRQRPPLQSFNQFEHGLEPRDQLLMAQAQGSETVFGYVKFDPTAAAHVMQQQL